MPITPYARAGPGRGGPGRGTPGGRGAGRGGPGRGGEPAGGPRRLPERGFFAEVDPKAEVVSPLARLNAPDPSKKGGRWAPEFVWNTAWAAGLPTAGEESKDGADAAAAAAPPRPPVPPPGAPPPTTGLALTRVADLNDMSVDLSALLLPRKKKEAAAATGQGASAGRGAAAPSSPSPSSPRYLPPEPKATQADERRWTRGGRFARAGPAAAPATPVDPAVAAADAAAAAAAYEKMKAETMAATLAVGAAGAVAAGALHGVPAAASFAVGAAGGALYLRLLNRSVDGLAGDGGGAGAAASQPRLLVPVILVLGANRWNVLKADEVGLTLEFLPLLAGFFAYKVAVVGRQAAVLLGGLRDAAASRDGNTPMGGA